MPFTFKANCPATLDCAAPPPGRPPAAAEQVPIDYLAKDFASFRQALSEFSALRYPAWVERSEADLGVVLMEVLAAMADELSYYQDRVAAEATIQTATQRLSVVRHARLVDYEPAPATVATTVLQLDVAAPPASSPPLEAAATSWTIDTPLLVRALGADGSATDFEIEDPATGLASPGRFIVDTRWNRGSLVPYYWDDSQRCLPGRLDRLLRPRSRPWALPRPAAAAGLAGRRQRRPAGPGTGHGGRGGRDVRPADQRGQPASSRLDQGQPAGAHGQRP